MLGQRGGRPSYQVTEVRMSTVTGTCVFDALIGLAAGRGSLLIS